MSGKELILGTALIAVLVSFVLVQRVSAPVQRPDRKTITLTAPDGRAVSLSVEVADDATERALGLMDRSHLTDGTGMLFVFEGAAPRSFWMKRTHIPLDILFFDEDGLFVSRASMDPCAADPCVTYDSAEPARYALEVNRGEALTADAGTGWTLDRGAR